MESKWIVQELLAEKSDFLEWDTYVIGTVEDDLFEEKIRTNDKEVAYWILNIIKWYDLFDKGIIVPTEIVNREIAKKLVKRKPRTVKK